MCQGESGQSFDRLDQDPAEAVDSHPSAALCTAQCRRHQQNGNEQQMVVTEQDVLETEGKEAGDLVAQRFPVALERYFCVVRRQYVGDELSAGVDDGQQTAMARIE